MQATHDLLFGRWSLFGGDFLVEKSDFDHFAFPGVVPRSFIGPLLLAGPAKVFGFLLDWTVRNVVVVRHSNNDYMPISIPDTTTRLPYQFGTRFSLAIYCAASLALVASSFQNMLSNTSATSHTQQSSKSNANSAIYFILLCACQFHLMFWGSRTIANSFALVTFQLALACLFQALYHCKKSRGEEGNRVRKSKSTRIPNYKAIFYVDLMIFCLTFTCVIFRAEVFPLSLALIIFTLFRVPDTKLSRVILVGTVSSVMSIALTVTVDSFFWQRLIWPELEVFLFNGVEGKSVEWGTSPSYYYFTNLMPRILPLAFVLAILFLFLESGRILLSLLVASKVSKDDKKTFSPSSKTAPSTRPEITIGNLLFFAFLHVSILSFIPHKEWRFIIYTIPLLNLAGSLILCRVEGTIQRRILIPAAILGTFCISLFMLYVSHYNYTGGVALYRFHDSALPLNPVPQKPVVYMDVHVAMTGASRFGQSPSCCIYDKNESVTTRQDFMRYDWVITGDINTSTNTALTLFPQHHWKRIEIIYGYDGLEVREPLSWIRESVLLVRAGTLSLLRLPVKVRLQEKAVILKRQQTASLKD